MIHLLILFSVSIVNAGFVNLSRQEGIHLVVKQMQKTIIANLVVYRPHQNVICRMIIGLVILIKVMSALGSRYLILLRIMVVAANPLPLLRALMSLVFRLMRQGVLFVITMILFML